MSDDRHEFGTGTLHAVVAADGAELQGLTASDTEGAARDLLWAGTQPWPRHSPVLFPIIGKLPDDRSTLAGHEVHLPQHGFARDLRFAWQERSETGCTLELTDDVQTRALFPQAFSLILAYEIEGDVLHVRYTLRNPDPAATLHASLGVHPAFAWPQVNGVPKDAHRLVFEKPEPEAIRQVASGLLQPKGVATPVSGDTLALHDSLFANDALIFEKPHSRQVRFVTPDDAGIEVSWNGFRSLGVWMKPGADFLCIEPWQGYATPEGFAGDFSEKPGLLHLAPGESWHAQWSVRPLSGR
jgi:galactose mutarotase-like enzyme